MKVWMLSLLTFSFSAYCSEFSHIKLNPEFEQYLTQSNSKSNSTKTLSLKSAAKSIVAPSSQTETSMKNALLGSQPTVGTASFAKAKSLAVITTPIPTDGEESLLYEEIRRHLEASHQSIGAAEVQNINRLNQQFNLGTSNFSGFSWQKPFGVVQVYADRQVTPNIFGQDWLVADTFTFSIEATTFLEKLNEAGLSKMSATEIRAFAGITFKRVYTYWHYADSYQTGLGVDFGKLFLAFTMFNQNSLEKMGNGEYIKREDVWTASAGGLITTPPVYNISFSAGVLAEYDYQNVTTVQSTTNPDTRFKVGVLSKQTRSAGATLELQLDFFKLLKFSLLRYDLNYEYASGKEFSLGFTTNQWNQVKADEDQTAEFKSILTGHGTVKRLEPYVVSLGESSSEAIDQRGSILLWGKMQKQKTEQIRTIVNNNVKVFFKNYSQNVKVVQNFFSRIFSAVFYKVFKFPVGVNNASIYSRQITMEYEATHPQATDPKITRVDSSEQFSFVLTQYYSSSRTDRFIDRKFKNDLVWFVDNFTTLPKSYKTDIRNEVLKGPILIESNLRVEKAGFQFLLDSPINDVFAQLAKVCESKKTNDWINEARRIHLLDNDELDPHEECVQNMGLKYMAFKKDYLGNFLKPSLTKFKEFMAAYYKESGNITDLQTLFGVDNTFINGKLQAQTGLGMAFNTTFSAGQFRGLGVIDTFNRSTGSRAPASIVSE
jgi:hypothetical protein